MKNLLTLLLFFISINICSSQGDKGPDVYNPPSNSNAVLPPGNDACTSAIPATVPSMVSGTTVDADVDAPPFCGTASTSPGVWYSLVGTGNMITIDLCGAIFDSKLSIYDGTCGALNCIIGEDDDFAICGGNDPSVDFMSSLGTTYYIHVHGFGGTNGPFDMTIAGEPVAPPPPIPTMSEWGVIILMIILSTFGILAIRQKKEESIFA